MKNPSSANLTNNVNHFGNTQTGHHYWIGRFKNGIDYYAGQTFKIPQKGNLKSICIFPEMIVGETDALLSVFEFDEHTREWKDKKAECHLMLNNSSEKKWVSFDMKNIPLDSSKQYAFKITCNHEGIMAIAECGWKEKDAYKDGEQWVGNSENPKGRFHRNFDLTFIAEMEN